MLVEQMMTSPVTTVDPRAPVGYAWRLLKQGGFRHLPVAADGALVGIVSDRDLQVVMLHEWTVRNPLRVESIMAADVVTVGPTTPIEEASPLMLERKIGALPVLEDGRLVGIVTESDLFRMIVRVLGVMGPSSRLQLELTGPREQLAEATRIANEHRVPIVSLVTEPTDGAMPLTVVLRVGTIAPEPFVRDLEIAGIVVRQPSTGAPGRPGQAVGVGG